MIAPMAASPVGNVPGPDPALQDSDDVLWRHDTGPFIDADDDQADYASGPVTDVGNFLDPDAG